MLRITKESEYAFLLLGAILSAEGAARNTATLAKEARIAVPMSGKVLKRLTQQGILESIRGARGGKRDRAGRGRSHRRRAGAGRMYKWRDELRAGRTLPVQPLLARTERRHPRHAGGENAGRHAAL